MQERMDGEQLAGRKRGRPSSMSSRLISNFNLFLADGHVTPTAVRSLRAHRDAQTDGDRDRQADRQAPVCRSHP